ncbi:hypothetical protein [Neobacillus vireti]|uniref:hypothetical protein n=1 Tax=Neobacillus vireti TaxID=220686 RepID=UPI00300086F8
MEAIVMFLNLSMAYKISRLYLNWLPSVVVALFLPIFLLNQGSFAFGDSAEEFSIPFLMTFLYIILKHFKLQSDTPFSWKVFFINGLLIGCVFWIKYTLVGIWIGFYLAVLIICISKKSWRELLNAVVFTFFGLVIATLPWFVYFGINHAIKDVIDVYIKFNLFTYSSELGTLGKLLNSAVIFGRAFNGNIEGKILMLIGMTAFIFTKKYLVNANQKWFFYCSVVFTIVGVYFGGRSYPYYFLIITPFSLFGLIAIADFIQNKLKPEIEGLNKGRWFSLSIVALTAFYLCFGVNANIEYSKFYMKDPLPQQTFANIMRQEPNPTLLNYGALDGGFYLAADITPNIRYFQSQNIDHALYPENMDEQHRYIKEGLVQFVVVRLFGLTPPEQVDIPHLADRYELVSQQDQLLGGTQFRYLLYKKVK